MEEKKIQEFAVANGYEAAVYQKEWNGYQCYEPVFSLDEPVSYIGLPLMILVKGENIRMSTADEAMELLEQP